MLGDKLFAFQGYLDDLEVVAKGIIISTPEEAVSRAIGWYEDKEAQAHFRRQYGEAEQALAEMHPEDPKREGVEKNLRRLKLFEVVMNHVAKMHRKVLVQVKEDVNAKKREIIHESKIN